jgi:hypothetical protein
MSPSFLHANACTQAGDASATDFPAWWPPASSRTSYQRRAMLMLGDVCGGTEEGTAQARAVASPVRVTVAACVE